MDTETKSFSDSFYLESNQKWLREAFDALDNGEGQAHELIEVEDK